jgi:ISXO2-like transposase domain
MLRVNHSREFKSDEGACANEAESWFSRLRRAEMGIHHRIRVGIYTNTQTRWRGARITAANQMACISAA